MNESTRTLSYVGAAAVSIVLAAFLAPSAPKAPSEFSEVGNAFYSDFVATDATSLTVVSFSEDTRAKAFNVELKNGKWVIGSHRNYPADGKDRLSKTATSVIGIKKEQFATRDPEQYASLQVIDPLDSDGEKLKGRGQRITLKDAGGKVLADYIIGKRVPNRDNYYYVRKPDEKSVYMAKLNIDLSTKFADWIESDLLKLQGENLNEIVINKYSIDKQRGRVVGQETSVLKRPKAADPWTLDGLNADKEEVNQDEVRTMTTALNDLKIQGVRPKPDGLTTDLKTDKGIALDAEAGQSLASKGFYPSNDGQLLSSEGEILPITDGGVAYTLRFGEVFIGSELEMETGLEAEKRKQDEKDGKGEKEEEKGSSKSRYVFITAHFDQGALGPKPEPPGAPAAATKTEEPAAKPEAKTDDAPPAATSEKPADEKPADEKPKEEPPPAEQPKDEKPAEEKAEPKAEESPKSGDCQDTEKKDDAEKKTEEAPAEPKPETKAPEAAAPAVAAPQKAPAAPGTAAPAAPKGPTPEEAAKAAAVEAQKKYETDLKAYEEKVTKGKAKVQELNERFAGWYYVISEENFLKLRLSRKSLVKDKTKPEAKPGEPKAGGELPGGLTLPGVTVPGDAKPEEPQPEAKKEEAPPAEPKAEEKKADEAKPDEKPADEKPAEPKAEEKKAEEPKVEEKKPE